VRKILIIVFIVCIQQLHAQPWIPDLGNGKYKNPIIYADYSDPDVVKVEDDFFMTASSFNCVPGLPILHSSDLVNWELVNHAIKRFPDRAFDTTQHGNGVWAPAIRFHDGWFYIYWGDPDRGIFMVRTKDPYGEWSAPVLVNRAYGNIDPCPLWDDDGKVYLVHAFANSRAGVNSILQVIELSDDGSTATRNKVIVFDGYGKHPTIEGPKFYKRNGYYYIFAPGGGVARGWQVVLRSKNVFGPYEDRIVLAQGKTQINGPHQGGWIELENGENWFVHFQEVQPYGRIVHLQPVKWVNDWPVMGIDKNGDGTGEPVLAFIKPDVKNTSLKVPQTSDDFDSSFLGLQWQWHGNYFAHWYSLSENKGSLRLYAQYNSSIPQTLWGVPNLLLQKFPAPEFTVTTKVNFKNLKNGERAGLVIMGLDYAVLAGQSTRAKTALTLATCRDAHRGSQEDVKESKDLDANILWLRVIVVKGGRCQFSFSCDGDTFHIIGEPFQAREGRWIGAKVGLFAVSSNEMGLKGYVDYEWFRVE
jgi:beta-xylosidase